MYNLMELYNLQFAECENNICNVNFADVAFCCTEYIYEDNKKIKFSKV